MDMNKEIYCLTLEDYSFPRYSNVVRNYYGTMEDVNEVISELDSNEWTHTRYWETIHAFDCFEDDPDVGHTAAGSPCRFLDPLTLLATRETVLHQQRWTYTGYSGAVYPMYAECVRVKQVLLQENGGLIYRCIKATFEGLSICAHGVGWYIQGGRYNGFPGMFQYEDDTHAMQMYVEEACYEAADWYTAVCDLHDGNKIDLKAACRDILGQV